jgi:16S rRNA (adenine1518-N6/adenine1519-N6)-dimethyltransferase
LPLFNCIFKVGIVYFNKKEPYKTPFLFYQTIMRSQGIKPKKYLGQVFLKNKKIIQKMVEALEVKEKDLILEIGAGKGILTESLLLKEAKVIAVEKDPQLVNFLKNRFDNNSKLQIIQGDIRDLLNSNFQFPISKQILNSKFQSPNSDYKVIGNIPYYLTSYLFRLLIDLKKKPKLVVLMVQKEVGQRIMGKPPKMNLLAVLVQTFFKPELILNVSKNNFWPKPKVDSVVIKLTPLTSPFKTKKEKEKFLNLIKAGFSQPRKLLINNLKNKLKISKNKLEGIFKKLNISLNIRAQDLALNQWFLLLNYF